MSFAVLHLKNAAGSQKSTQAAILFFLLIYFTFPTNANDREADLFEEEIFLDDTRPSLAETLSKSLGNKDKNLDIGGRFYYTNSLFVGEDEIVSEGKVTNTGIIDLYFDAILEDNLRFYFQQKFFNSVELEQELVPLILSQLSQSSDIDQLWLKFKLKERYYFTLGKQPIKLGAGFVWKTTDFINIDRFNPLALTDQRLGVNLIKIQVPFSNYGLNLSAIAQFDEAETFEEIGTFLRLEYLTETAEYAISINNRKYHALHVGFDASKGFNLFDWLFSIALVHNDPTPFFIMDTGQVSSGQPDPLNPPPSIDRSNEWLQQISTGFLYSSNIFDNETLLINVELFYNEAGYKNSDLMPFIIVNSLLPGSETSFNPLYFNKYYGALGFTLLGLGHDNDQSITTILINNFDDDTGVAQLIYRASPFRDLSISTSIGWFFGNNGTFRPSVDIFSNPALEGLTPLPPRFFTQIQLSLSF